MYLELGQTPSLWAIYMPTNTIGGRPIGQKVMSNSISIFNWSATNMLVTTVQWRNKQHRLADKLIRSLRSILLIGIYSSGVFCPLLLHCTVLTDFLMAKELKLTNFVSKNGRQMRHTSADQHYLTILIFWLDDTERQNIHRSSQRYLFPFVCGRRMPLRRRPI